MHAPGKFRAPHASVRPTDRLAQLERELAERDAQVRSLLAEVARLQQFVPRDVIKGQRRPTRREKQAMVQ